MEPALKIVENVAFHVGQVGEFTLFDAFHEPIETVHGRILKLMDGKDSLYAMIETERGVRPGRLCRNKC